MKEIISPVETADNLFHDGDHATGTEGTVVHAKWLNAIQGAVMDTQTEQKNILAAAGMQPNAEQNNQLSEAINRLMRHSLEEDSRQSLLQKNNGADIPDKAAFVKNLGLSNTVEQAKHALDKRTGGTVKGSIHVTESIHIGGEDAGLRANGDGNVAFYAKNAQVAAWDSDHLHWLKDVEIDGMLKAKTVTFGSNIIVSWDGRTATFHENGDVTGPIWGGTLSTWINNRTQVSGGRGGWWYKDESSGFILQGGMVKRSGNNIRVNFPIGYSRECFGVQMTLSTWQSDSGSNIFATAIENSGFTAVMYSREVEANWWAVGV